MDFEVGKPLGLHPQNDQDECTANALASIGELATGKRIDPKYNYLNSDDEQFGITPSRAMLAVINQGLKTENGEIIFPFSDFKKVKGFFSSYFTSIRNTLLKEKKPLFCGVHWQPHWIDGKCTVEGEWYTFAFHAFMVYGFTEINGKIYIKAWDYKGLWLMPEEVVNRFRFSYKLI